MQVCCCWCISKVLATSSHVALLVRCAVSHTLQCAFVLPMQRLLDRFAILFGHAGYRLF